MAAMAAVALVTRRRDTSPREPDIYPGRREEPRPDRDPDPDGRDSESGMY
jgi:hypothetical protein